MKRTLYWLAAVNLLLHTPALPAAELEIPGIITDHTVTSVGHDFYRSFADKWGNASRENITINERPSARWGSWITIKINQDVLYQTFLFPIKRDFDKNVDAAVEVTQDAINQRQIDQSLLRTDDLAHDEF